MSESLKNKENVYCKKVQDENGDVESSDEGSIIILSSDTENEVETGASDCEDEDDENFDGDEEDEDEDDDENEEDEQSSVVSDSSDESDSEGSVWSTADEETGDVLTSEAAEAKIIRSFEKAVFYIADKHEIKGKRQMEKLLRNPILRHLHREEFDFDDNETRPRLSKMHHVFISIHKNLAVLNKDNAVNHYLQILSHQPNNTSVWFDLAMKSVENGDLNMAKYSFEMCENEKESVEARATVLFLTHDYHACLSLLKSFQDEIDQLNDKMLFLKQRIRDTNYYYKQLCNDIFEEDDVYTEIDQLHPTKYCEFEKRLNDLKKTIDDKATENDNKLLEQRTFEDIVIKIDADQDFVNISTLFCDLFDRIQAYSSISQQLIYFEEWENRRLYLDVKESLDECIDVVCCVESLTENVVVDRKKVKRSEKYLKTWKKRLFGQLENNDTDDESVIIDDTDDESSSKNNAFPHVDLADEFDLYCSGVDPIIKDDKKIADVMKDKYVLKHLDDELILEELREKLNGKRVTIWDVLGVTLLTISNLSPNNGTITKNLKPVIVQMYRRLDLICNKSFSSKFWKLHVMMFELGEALAHDYCIKKYIFNTINENEYDDESPYLSYLLNSEMEDDEEPYLISRFLWAHGRKITDDEIKISFLYILLDKFSDESSLFYSSTGAFGYNDVKIFINELEKKKRIESIKSLWTSSRYNELISVMENDIDFSIVNPDETFELLDLWMKSYRKLKKRTECLKLSVRIFHLYLINDYGEASMQVKIKSYMESLIERLGNINWSVIDLNLKLSIGYFICLFMSKFKEMEKKATIWKCLYSIINAIQVVSKVDYVKSLDRQSDPDLLPTPGLELLAKAHQKLGQYKKCSEDNYSFLLFIIDEIRVIVDDIPLLEALFEKENVWLWNNLNNEIAQCLYCLFGKYGKKKRNVEDHSSKSQLITDWAMAKRILPIILVQPLPLHDDKERLGHDVADLLLNKFEFSIKVSDEREKCVEKFRELLKSCSSMGINEITKEIENVVFKEEEIQSLIWYALTLTYYRQESHDLTRKYAELYLSSSESITDDRLRTSVWVILAHEHVIDLFQLSYPDLFEQWRWHILPFRLALKVQNTEAIIHFDTASTMYQVATALKRFLYTLPSDDMRRKRLGDMDLLRDEARYHFEKCLSLSNPSIDGTPPEYQWLCYFFLAKLEAKKDNFDVNRIVENFYEAACGCELAGFYYPSKVNTKKQTNFEPLEVHYQVHAAAWKFIYFEENPKLQTLVELESYLKTFLNGHKVVNSSYSMFRIPADIRQIVSNMVHISSVTANGNSEVEKMLDETLTKVELIESIKDMCLQAFAHICERFPHIKSHYRLAEMFLDRGELELASDHIFKSVFRRKKRDDNLFDNIVEISNNDINRSGSFTFHVQRCLKMGIKIAEKLNDLHNIVSMLIAVVNKIVLDDEQYFEKKSRFYLVRLLLMSLDSICSRLPKSARNTPSPTPFGLNVKRPRTPTTSAVKMEFYRLWNALIKNRKEDVKLLKAIEKRIESLIVKVFGSLDDFKEKVLSTCSQEALAKKRNVVKKRKIGDFESIAQPFLKKVATTSVDESPDINEIQSTSETTSNTASSFSSNMLGTAKSSVSLNVTTKNNENKIDSNAAFIQQQLALMMHQQELAQMFNTTNPTAQAQLIQMLQVMSKNK